MAIDRRLGSFMELLSSTPTSAAPASAFSGKAWIEALVRGARDSRLRVSTVRFAPGARTPWHSHGLGQTLIVIEGAGVVATATEALVVRAGDIVHTPAGEEHWHGALPGHPMTHVAVWEGDQATVGDHVTDLDYLAAAQQSH